MALIRPTLLAATEWPLTWKGISSSLRCRGRRRASRANKLKASYYLLNWPQQSTTRFKVVCLGDKNWSRRTCLHRLGHIPTVTDRTALQTLNIEDLNLVRTLVYVTWKMYLNKLNYKSTRLPIRFWDLGWSQLIGDTSGIQGSQCESVAKFECTSIRIWLTCRDLTFRYPSSLCIWTLLLLYHRL